MNIKEILTEEEIASITSKDDFAAARIILFDWFVIISTFVVVGTYTNPLTIVLGIFVLGARQLGFGVVVHETGHRTLFKSPAWNDFVGNWLAGYWVFSNTTVYMKGHIKHHQKAGTEEDPDLKNYQSYPVDRASLKRKFIRDLTGQVGYRRIRSIVRAFSRLNQLDDVTRQYLIRSLAVNLAMLVILTLFGAPWLYLIWIAAFVTSHMLVVRIRQIGEHAAVPDLFDLDPRMNTRTVYVGWLQRFFIAPHQINYHLEHHILASVPIYRLEKMHKLLLKSGYYEDMEFEDGYFNVLKNVSFA